MALSSQILTPDTQVILLLTGSLGQVRGKNIQPLSAAEYHQFAQLLHRNQLRPADLLTSEGLAHLSDAEPLQFDSNRIERLLGRGAALGLVIESWTNQGVWVISRSDAQYPQQLRARLGKLAPPILYGVGNQELLTLGGLAIVGSRVIDDAEIAFTRALAARCAHDGLQVISGGARGVDSEAMLAALDAGGSVVGVLADSLLKAAVTGKYRTALRFGKMTLLTTYDPSAGFNVGNAMGRNKQIYALSDFALVVNSALEQGGTWSGAIENLTHRWVPLFVRAPQPMPPGNQRLIDRGGVAFLDSTLSLEISLKEWFGQPYTSSESVQTDLFTAVENLETTRSKLAESPQDYSNDMRSEPLQADSVAEGKEDQNAIISQEGSACALLVTDADQLQPSEPPITPSQAEGIDLFPIVWQYLEAALQSERTEREIAELFAIELSQARAWLQRATKAGMLKKRQRPVRYVVAVSTKQATMLPLIS